MVVVLASSRDHIVDLVFVRDRGTAAEEFVKHVTAIWSYMSPRLWLHSVLNPSPLIAVSTLFIMMCINIPLSLYVTSPSEPASGRSRVQWLLSHARRLYKIAFPLNWLPFFGQIPVYFHCKVLIIFKLYLLLRTSYVHALTSYCASKHVCRGCKSVLGKFVESEYVQLLIMLVHGFTS